MTTAEEGIATVLGQDQQAVRCPYPYYKQLREQTPVYHDVERDIYVVTRHADIMKVNTQPTVFSNQNPMGPTVSDAIAAVGRVLATAEPAFVQRVMVVMRRGDVLFTQDPPAHTRHRRILNRAFTPRAVARIEPEIRAACHALVDKFADDGYADMVSAFCTPAPVHALAQLLGVQVERSGDFARWSAAINASIGSAMTDEQVLATLHDQVEFWDFFEAEIADRIKNPGEDLISAITKAAEGETPLTLNEMVGFCSQFIGAGADTTNKQLSSFLLLLCRNPEMMARLRARPEELPQYLEEGLRMEAPVQGLFRVTTVDTELGGVAIPAGAHVWLVYGSSNRDEEVFDHPDEFDVERARLRSHHTFGVGPHSCIGAPLARAVSRIGFEVLFDRLDDIALADPEFEPEYHASYIMHGMESLPITFRAV
jgi:cytochrome P450